MPSDLVATTEQSWHRRARRRRSCARAALLAPQLLTRSQLLRHASVLTPHHGSSLTAKVVEMMLGKGSYETAQGNVSAPAPAPTPPPVPPPPPPGSAAAAYAFVDRSASAALASGPAAAPASRMQQQQQQQQHQQSLGRWLPERWHCRGQKGAGCGFPNKPNQSNCQRCGLKTSQKQLSFQTSNFQTFKVWTFQTSKLQSLKGLNICSKRGPPGDPPWGLRTT